jgi:hypothetical protein
VFSHSNTTSQNRVYQWIQALATPGIVQLFIVLLGSVPAGNVLACLLRLHDQIWAFEQPFQQSDSVTCHVQLFLGKEWILTPIQKEDAAAVILVFLYMGL